MTHRLINDVIKPWEELNNILVKRFAFQPELSDITRLASALAISIKHQVDHRETSRAVVDSASDANRVLSDVADFAKHGGLRDPSRNARLYVASCFQYAPGRGFRFIRNSITIEHPRLGELDFTVTALAATRYWMDYLGISLNRELVVSEGRDEFFPSAYLYFNPKYCFRMDQTRLKFFSKEDGHYRPVDPPQVKFEVFEIPDESKPPASGTD